MMAPLPAMAREEAVPQLQQAAELCWALGG